jgi:hypothetical protein
MSSSAARAETVRSGGAFSPRGRLGGGGEGRGWWWGGGGGGGEEKRCLVWVVLWEDSAADLVQEVGN